MIIPQSENDLTLNILVLGGEIIKIIKNSKSVMIIEDVMRKFLDFDTRRTPNQFLDALTLLFVTQLVEIQGYRIKLKSKNDYTQMPLF